MSQTKKEGRREGGGVYRKSKHMEVLAVQERNPRTDRLMCAGHFVDAIIPTIIFLVEECPYTVVRG